MILASFSLLLACSESADPGQPASGSGGSANATGGSVSTGGRSATGGMATGGSTPGSGGTPSSGGSGPAFTGGTSSGSGGAASAGKSSSGGSSASSGAGGTTSGGAAGGSATGGAGPIAGAAGTPASGGSGSGGSCTRDALSGAVDSYLKALIAHDPAAAPISPTAKYTENTETVTVGEGLWKSAGETKLVRKLIDTQLCTTVSEVVLPEDGTDVVMTLRLKVDGGSITEIESIITREGDWLFKASGYVDSKSQLWDVLPEDQRSTREELLAAAKAYFDVFNDDSVEVPFGPGCQRLEGGAATAQCTMGIPSGVPIGNRRYWADVEAGVSVGIVLFGGNNGGLLDAHYFRMIDSTIRNVHSMTVDSQFTTTGWPKGE